MWTTMIAKIITMQAMNEDRSRITEIMKKRLQLKPYSKKYEYPEKDLDKSLLPSESLLQNEKLGHFHKTNPESRKAAEIVKILREAVKLAVALTGDNNTNINNRTIKIGSPRLLSVVPDEAKNEINMLSPTLFSLHDQGKAVEKLTSLPGLFKSLAGRDYDQWLSFIAEASGATDVVDRMKEQFIEPEIPAPWSSMPRGIDGQPLYFTKNNISDLNPEQKETIKIFAKITKSLTTKQLMDFNSTGYSLLTREQLIQLYGPSSPYNNSAILNQFLSVHPESLHDRIIRTIRQLANTDSKSARQRWKRQVVLSPLLLTPFIFNPKGVSTPIILSPVVLSPLVFSPAIFGVVILSPWLFVPIILSPRLMCPAIVSPAALSPFVLSPLVMDPFILSPGAIIPYILSPKVLSPNVLSPSVMTPLVLNPFCLSPNILSPSAVTAIVLSPFVLSPFVYSPAYIAAIMFSPNAFSPLINSTGKAVTTLFSPSIFS